MLTACVHRLPTAHSPQRQLDIAQMLLLLVSFPDYNKTKNTGASKEKQAILAHSCRISVQSHLTPLLYFCFLLFLTLWVWVFYLYVYLCTMCMPGVLGGQKRPLDALEPEVQIVVSCLIWVLEIKVKSSFLRTTSALNCCLQPVL